MTGNPLPWAVLAAVVFVTLAFKGYVKLPPLARPAGPALPPPAAAAQTPSTRSAVDPDELAKLGSLTLGLAFAKAKRREAEEHIAYEIARTAGEAIHATFTGPFSPPAPAGQGPSQAAANP
jgi:hypothetical protein